MNKDSNQKQTGAGQSLPGPDEWEMISGFVLSLGAVKTGDAECLLKPVEDGLKPFGITDGILCEISASLEKTGEEMRSNCTEGRVNCINVRIYVTRQMQSGRWVGGTPVRYFLNQIMASSESDTLEALENPCCYIDLYVYPSPISAGLSS